MKKCLENIKKNAVDIPARTITQKPFPREVAEAIYEEIDTRDGFAVPIKTINEALGLSSENDRVSMIKKKLNSQHSDLLEDGYEWYVGTAEKGTLYKFEVREKKVEG